MEMTRKRIIYTISVSLIVVFSTTFAILMTLERIDYRNYLQAEYSKNMYELITSVDNIRNDLSKAAITGTREQNIIVFEEIFRYAAAANDKLHSLPVSQETLGDTSKFLSQVGDFCYTLVRASSEGRSLTEEEYATIDKLKDQSVGLQTQLNVVLADINEGKVKWGEIRKKASGVFAKTGEETISEKFKGIQKQVAQYPALIYDGPFSDNVQQIEPKVVKLPSITQAQAEEIVKTLVGKDRIENIDKVENTVSGDIKNIKTYRFSISIKGRGNKDDKLICEITKNGGKVTYLLDNRKINNASLDINKALGVGTKYLENIGFKNMVPSYQLKYDNTAVINYVYSDKNILVYPDQIKLKVALDNGDIIGIEAQKYLVSHEDNRKISAPKISQKEAKNKVSSRLAISSVRLVIVPTFMDKEALCYEFSGSYKKDNFKVYIDANTGYEQRIMQIIDTPNGKLTM